ncbi:UNVERIFIED_CONTAM: hypothetical protein Sradi_5228900, partial [Sesamum radiatum]
MRRLQENRDKAVRKWTNGLCPKIQNILQKHVEKIDDCIPIKVNDRHYQISCYDGAQFFVDLERRTCTCRHWQLSGIPCKHACNAIFNQNLKPEDMVHAYYNVEIYKAVYEPAILSISGELLWTETVSSTSTSNFGKENWETCCARRREPDEQQLKTKKGKGKGKGKKPVKPYNLKRQACSHHCTICGEVGHNAKGCALWKDMQEPVEGISSDPTSIHNWKKRASSSSNLRPRKHCTYVDPSR